MSAFGRAYHAQCETPVFADTQAKRLLPEYEMMGEYVLSGMDFFAPERKGTFSDKGEALRYLMNTQIVPTPVARARFCEDSLFTALCTGTEQYVILGAGLDTFALRNKGNVPVFEVDHPLTQEDKRERLANAGIEIPENLRFVPVDFTKDDLQEALLSSGFDPKKKTFFSWLGVSYYLSADDVERMLATLARLSAEGSSLVFDVADERLFSSPVRRVKNMLAMAQAGGEGMKSCFSYGELERLLEKYGFLIYEWLTPSQINEQYFANRTDDLTAFEHICYANAVKKL